MSTASKLNGYGNVPGYGKVTNATKLSKAPKFGTPALQQAPTGLPSFNAYTAPPAATYSAAQAGSSPDLSNSGSASGSGPGVAADPRDPTYWTDVAKIKNTFDTTNQGYDLQQTQGQTQLNNSLAALDRQQPIDTSNQSGQYNDNGLFYSSKLTGAEGELIHQYATNRTNSKTGFTNLVDSLNILRKQNQNQYGTGANGELTGTAYGDALNNAVGRATTADQLAAQQNSLVAPQVDPTAGPAAIAELLNRTKLTTGKAKTKMGSSWGGLAKGVYG